MLKDIILSQQRELEDRIRQRYVQRQLAAHSSMLGHAQPGNPPPRSPLAPSSLEGAVLR